MKIIKCCLKYLLTFLMPLIALRLSVRFIGSGLHMSPMEIIRVYVVIVLLLFSVLHLRFKKFEPIVLLLPLLYIYPFCLNPYSYSDIMSSEQPLIQFFSDHLLMEFWSGQRYACLLFAAYLAKFFIEIALNIRDAIKGRKEPVTAEGPSEEASLSNQETEQAKLTTETTETAETSEP